MPFAHDTDRTSTEAAISNPNNSEEAKERAQQRLQEMDESGELRTEAAHLDNVKIDHKVRPCPVPACHREVGTHRCFTTGCCQEPERQPGGQAALQGNARGSGRVGDQI